MRVPRGRLRAAAEQTPGQHLKVIDCRKNNEQTVCPGDRPVAARQRRVLVIAPLVEAQQDRAVRIDRSGAKRDRGPAAISGWPSSDGTSAAGRHIAVTPMIVHVRFIDSKLS